MMRLATVLLALAGLVASSFAATPQDLLREGRIDQAIAAARGRTQQNPNDADAWLVLGRANYYIERWDDSIEAFERATSLRPNDSATHMWLGRAYGEKASNSNFLRAMKLAGKVREQFERAVQLDSSSVQARSDLAEYYVEAPGVVGGGIDKARTQAEAITKLSPSSGHYLLARIAVKDKKYDEAERQLKLAVERGNEKAPQYWLNLASFYRARSRFAEMEAAIQKAVAGRKDAVLVDAAEILLRAGRNFSYAAQLLREYIERGVHSEDAPVFRAHYTLGTLLEKQGDRQGAAKQYRASLALASGFSKAQQALKRVQ